VLLPLLLLLLRLLLLLLHRRSPLRKVVCMAASHTPVPGVHKSGCQHA
jgi:hypothetical protein